MNRRGVKKGAFVSVAEAAPWLIPQWDTEKNGDLTPENVSAGSGRRVHWRLRYDDSKTGRHFEFTWTAKVYSRVSGAGCPYLIGKGVWPGFNDLESQYPELALQWHPTKNGGKKPSEVAAQSNKRAWWYLPYDDPETGRHFDFDWEAIISNRIRGAGCPFLTGKAAWPGYNDLATVRPDLAAEWHPTKNGKLRPEDVLPMSKEIVWWYLPYDDPKTGEHFDFEWRTAVCNRMKGSSCPYLSGMAIWPGFNDLATLRPDLAAQWHPTRNGDLTPKMVTIGTAKMIWWYLPYDDPETGEHFNFEWRAELASRVKGAGCPYLAGKAVHPGFNDLATVRPDLAAQWHPTKNGDLTPAQVTVSSDRNVWWYLPYDDPKSGRHFDFEWSVCVSARTSGNDCPYLSGKAVWIGFNDLATVCPAVAAQWHPTRNGELTPQKVTAYTCRVVWWLLPYDDPRTGKHFDFEWQASIYDRVMGGGCPYLSGEALFRGFNDLATVRPDLAAQWHPTKNGELTARDVMSWSSRFVWWYLPYDDPVSGEHFDFEWLATVANRAAGSGCPYLVGRGAWPGYNDLASQVPEVAAEWHPTRNRTLRPDAVSVHSGRKVWWKCPVCGHEWMAAVANRTGAGSRCPACMRRRRSRVAGKEGCE